MQYGLLHAHCTEIRHGIERCSRNYPSTAQLAETLESSHITPQMLGNVLSLLVQLNVIGVYSDRNNGNRYDLTQYDYDRMHHLTGLLETASLRSVSIPHVPQERHCCPERDEWPRTETAGWRADGTGIRPVFSFSAPRNRVR
ncbi:hypothetical protein [Haladaptatus sp. NG-WS-4]